MQKIRKKGYHRSLQVKMQGRPHPASLSGEGTRKRTKKKRSPQKGGKSSYRQVAQTTEEDVLFKGERRGARNDIPKKQKCFVPSTQSRQERQGALRKAIGGHDFKADPFFDKKKPRRKGPMTTTLIGHREKREGLKLTNRGYQGERG